MGDGLNIVTIPRACACSRYVSVLAQGISFCRRRCEIPVRCRSMSFCVGGSGRVKFAPLCRTGWMRSEWLLDVMGRILTDAIFALRSKLNDCAAGDFLRQQAIRVSTGS